jgi:carbamoyl-phosphate synthase large subunit
MTSDNQDGKKILVVGIGVGSLGLELLKCLRLENIYEVYGVDIDENAYGHFNSQFTETFTINSSSTQNYCEDLIKICHKKNITYIVPGSEATNRIISLHQDQFYDAEIFPLVNSLRVFNICTNKIHCNEFLKSKNLPSLETVFIPNGRSLNEFSKFPCVVKPAVESGGSNLVFIAENLEEAKFFVSYLASRGIDAGVQEYIDSSDEFTVGVLSNPDGKILSSIALKRNLSSKLSLSLAYGDRIISSGWSQGRIEQFPDVCSQAEQIALALGSTWALNIQGRVKDGVFIPFEINPRHSGTSYFRAMSGVNEILIGLNYLMTGKKNHQEKIKPATYSRILKEQIIFDGEKI